MKKAKKLLAMFLAVIMLFSVMSVGLGGIVSMAKTVTIGGTSADTVDEVIIAVPETIYMKPSTGASVSGQYYVNNTVDQNGNVALAVENAQLKGSIGIYAPGSTAMSFTATTVTTGVGDVVIGGSNTSADVSWESIRWAHRDVYAYYKTGSDKDWFLFSELACFINGTGLTAGQTALVEWAITVYFGDDDTTGVTYYAYTTLYAPFYIPVAAASTIRTKGGEGVDGSSKAWSQSISWISGVHGYSDFTGENSNYHAGYRYANIGGSYTIVPLINGSITPSDNGEKGVANWFSENSGGNAVNQATIRYSNNEGESATNVLAEVSPTAILAVDTSRYTNLNQIPNLTIGFMVTDTENADDSKWYFSDYTSGDASLIVNTREGEVGNFWNATGTILSGNSGSDYTGSYTRVLHNDKWNRSITDNNTTYVLKGASYVHAHALAVPADGYAYTFTYINLNVNKSDKSALRAEVMQCTSLNKDNYTDASWTPFYTALKNAAQILGDPTKTADAAAPGAAQSAYDALVAAKKALKTPITFDAVTNGGGMITSSTTFDVQIGANKEFEIGVGGLSGFKAGKAGYTFLGWSTTPDAVVENGELKNEMGKYDAATDKFTTPVTVGLKATLYAIYAKDITVEFNYLVDPVSKETEVTTKSATVYNNDTSAAIVPVAGEDKGDYKFVGWASSSAETAGKDLGTSLEGVTESTKYYATYQKTVELSFDANGGNINNITPVSGTINYNYDLSRNSGAASVTLPTTQPTMAGHTFKGWSINGATYNPGTTVGITEDTEALAVWSADQYTVTFNYKIANGTDKTATQYVEYQNAATTPADYAQHAYADENQHYVGSWDKTFDSITENTVVTATYTLAAHNFKVTDSQDKKCDVDGYIEYTCEDCGYRKVETIAGGHEYDDGVVTDPTCTTGGYTTYTCAVCGGSYTDNLTPALGHEYEETVTPPTCEEDGYTTHTCIRGDDVYVDTYVDALGHDYSSVVTAKATCEADSVKTFTCANDITHTYTEVIAMRAHKYDKGVITTPATCEADGVKTFTCTNTETDEYAACTNSYTEPVSATGHDWDDGVVTTVPECLKEGVKTFTCNNDPAHTRTEVVPATGHKLTGSGVETEPTCTKPGLGHGTCGVCGDTVSDYEIPALGHDYTDVAFADDKNGETHSKTCTRNCGEEGATVTEAHKWNEGVETKAPTCEVNGETEYTCKVCQATKTEADIPALGHDYVGTVTPATCTSQGYTTYVCSNDPAHTYVSDYVAPIPHDYKREVTVEATCTSTGLLTYTCKNCPDSYTETIAMKDHTWDSVVQTKAPTCSEEGEKKYTCGICGETKTEKIEKLTHTYTATVTPVTCTSDGYTTYTCKNCGDSYTGNYVTSTGHSYSQTVVSPTCTAQGYTTFTCTVCGESHRDNYVAATGHDLTAVVTAPTCTKQGYTTHTCSICNYSYRDEYVNATGHDYSIIAEIAPTCTKQGYIQHTCSKCDSSYKTDYVPATGHSYKETDRVSATATKNGYIRYTCEICGAYYDEMIYAGGKALVCVTLYGEDNRAIPDATITVTNQITGVVFDIVTDKNGYFTYVFPEGDYTLVIHKSGYIDNEGYLTVSGGVADLNLPKLASNPCDCLCHSDSIWGQIYRVLIKLFSIFGRIYCCDDSEIWN